MSKEELKKEVKELKADLKKAQEIVARMRKKTRKGKNEQTASKGLPEGELRGRK